MQITKKPPTHLTSLQHNIKNDACLKNFANTELQSTNNSVILNLFQNLSDILRWKDAEINSA